MSTKTKQNTCALIKETISPQWRVDKFTYLGNSISSIETEINTRLEKEWTTINRLLVIWKSDLNDTLTKRMEKKLDRNYTRMLQAVLNKSTRQYSTQQQLYGHLPSIPKTIEIRQTRNERHCWRSKDELISDVIQRTPSHGRAKIEPTYNSSVPIQEEPWKTFR